MIPLLEKAAIILGAIFVLAGLLLYGYYTWDDHRAKENSARIVNELKAAIVDGKKSVALAGETAPIYKSFRSVDMPVFTTKSGPFVGILSIETLNLILPVYSDWRYERLVDAPCKYSGTAYAKNLVIAAHNYNAHFGTIYSLNEGDQISFTDMDGNVFWYEVSAIEVLGAEEVEEMVNSPWALSLFTCTVGGKDRVTIRCSAINS